MIKHDVLAQITELLITMNSEKATFSTDQEAYFAKLDVSTADRPAQIIEIMRSLGAFYPIDILMKLETYITDLEQQQHNQSVATASLWDKENPPQWSHQRLMQRQRRRQLRANQKVKNTYQ